MPRKKLTRVQLIQKAHDEMSAWFAATDSQEMANARRRYQRTCNRLYALDLTGAKAE